MAMIGIISAFFLSTATNRPGCLISVHHRHHHVGEDDVRANLDNLLPGILTVHGLDDLIVGKHITHKLAEVIAINLPEAP